MSSGLLGGAVRMIVIQFSFSNFKQVPPGIREKEDETIEGYVGRKSAPKGEMLLDGSVQKVSLLKCLSDLDLLNYQLVDAWWQKRVKNGRPYPAVRFIFVHLDHVQVSDEFLEARDRALGAFRKMAREAMWQLRAFLNPFFENKDLVPGQRAISLNLEHRQPLVDKEGEPLMVWKRKDPEGQPVREEEKISLQPDWLLRINEKGLDLTRF